MKKVLVYVQHLLGTGHLYRTARITTALANAGYHVTVVSGGVADPGIEFGNVSLIQLPAVKTDSEFTKLYDQDGHPLSSAYRQNRVSRLLDIYRQKKPDLLLIETYPFGRRQMRFELLPLLNLAHPDKAGGTIIACSIRDVIQPKTRAERVDEICALVDQYFDYIFVHGDEGFINLEASFPESARFVNKVIYTGYVGPLPESPGPVVRRTDHILVSAGGGAVGHKLYRNSVKAAFTNIGRQYSWHILVGNNITDKEFSDLERQATDQVVVERNRPDFQSLLAECSISVSQAGYNTIMDILVTNTRAVVIPFQGQAEREQLIRARAFEAKGRLSVITEQQLSPDQLLNIINESLDCTSLPVVSIKMNGPLQLIRFLDQILDN